MKWLLSQWPATDRCGPGQKFLALKSFVKECVDLLSSVEAVVGPMLWGLLGMQQAHYANPCNNGRLLAAQQMFQPRWRDCKMETAASSTLVLDRIMFCTFRRLTPYFGVSETRFENLSARRYIWYRRTAFL